MVFSKFWLFHNGFSIGFGDTIADHNTMSYITQNIAEHSEQKANVTLTMQLMIV